MASPSKTAGTSLLSFQTIAAATVVTGSAVDVSTKFSGMVFVQFGRTVATALSNAVRFRIDASSVASADGNWFPLYEWISDVTVAVRTAATAAAAGGTSITVTNTGMLPGDKILIQNGTPANSEWSRIKALVSTTGLTIEDVLVNAQTTSNIATKAEFFAIPVKLDGVVRIRLVVSTAQPTSGQTIAVEATLTTMDSIA